MTHSHSPRATSWTLRLLCLMMAGLTACSSTRPQYAWTDRGSPGRRDASKSSPILERWGVDSESPSVQDPTIAPGFLLTLSSVTDRKLNGDFRVDFDGALILPYEINVNTTGTTVSALKKQLAGLYLPYFKSAPDIDLRIKERRYWVEIRGLVQTPGRYLTSQNASLDQVISLAGGAEKDAFPEYVRIQKGQKVFVFDLNPHSNQADGRNQIVGWLGGELVSLQKEYTGPLGDRPLTLPSRLPIYLLGEVRKPGEYTLKPGEEFVDMLTEANGFTDRANIERIEIVRRTGGRRRTYEFSWNEFQRAPAPLPGDIVLVHSDNRTKSEFKLQLAAVIVSILTSAAVIYELNRSNNNNSR